MLASFAQTANHMNIFTTLAERNVPCIVAELAAPSGADVIFTGNILHT